LAKNNYAYEKRQRDLAKKKKKEEKKLKKMNQAAELSDSYNDEIEEAKSPGISESEDTGKPL